MYADQEAHPIVRALGFDERTQNTPHPLPVGTVLRGQYTASRVLGQGGSGISRNRPCFHCAHGPESADPYHPWEEPCIKCREGAALPVSSE